MNYVPDPLRTENPARFLKNFSRTISLRYSEFHAAAERFEHAVSSWSPASDAVDDIDSSFQELTRPYFRIWYATLDLAQSEAAQPALVEQSVAELLELSKVYFRAKSAFRAFVSDFYDPHSAPMTRAVQAEMF